MWQLEPPHPSKGGTSSELKFLLQISKIQAMGNWTGLITWFHPPDAMKGKRDGERESID